MKLVSICAAPHIDEQLGCSAQQMPSGQQAASPAPASSSSLAPSGLQAASAQPSSSPLLAPSGQQAALPAPSPPSSLAPSGQPAPKAKPGVAPSLAENVKAVSLHFTTNDRAKLKKDLETLRETVRAKAPGGARTADLANAAWLADGVYIPWFAATTQKRVRAWLAHHINNLALKIVFHTAPWTDLGAGSSWNEAERASACKSSLAVVRPPSELPPSNELQEHLPALRPRPCLVLDVLAARENEGQQILRKRARDYTLKEQLGGGTFGTVFHATRLDEDCVVKRFRPSAGSGPLAAVARSQVDSVVSEAYVLERCAGHPHIISLLDVVMAPSGQFMLVFEFMGQDLEARFRQRGSHIHQAITRSVFEHVLRVFVHLHDTLGLAHSDVKPQNCLILETKPGQVRVKLADLGCVVCADPVRRPPVQEGTITTLSYRAPELVLGLDDFNASIDMWSLGVLVARLSGDSFTHTKDALSSPNQRRR